MISSKTSSSSPPWRPPGAVPTRPWPAVAVAVLVGVGRKEGEMVMCGAQRATNPHFVSFRLYRYQWFQCWNKMIPISWYQATWVQLIPLDSSVIHLPSAMAIDAWAYGVLAAFIFMVVCRLARRMGFSVPDLEGKKHQGSDVEWYGYGNFNVYIIVIHHHISLCIYIYYINIMGYDGIQKLWCTL